MATQPTLDMIDTNYLPTVRDFFGEQEGQREGWVYLERKRQLVFPSLGSVVYLRTASEPDSCRGPTLAAASMDEMGNDDQFSTFRILQRAIRQPGYPNQLWGTTTPNVRRPWIKQVWQERVNPLTGRQWKYPDQYVIFRAATTYNVYLPQWQRTEHIEEYEGTREAAQELYGEFIAVEGAAFPDLSETHLRRPPAVADMKRVVVGLDFGASQPTALVAVGQDHGNRLYALAEFYKRNARDEEWMNWCADNGVKKVICDPSAAERDLELWRRTHGIPIQRAKSKRFDVRKRMVGNRLAKGPDGRPGLYISPDCPNLWDELMNLAHHRPRGQDYDIDQWTPGAVDHAYDALAYAIMEIDGGRIGRPNSPFDVIRRGRAA
jgi:hypothetical protein